MRLWATNSESEKDLEPEVDGVHVDVSGLLESLAGEVSNVEELESSPPTQSIAQPSTEAALGSESLWDFLTERNKELEIREQVPGPVHGETRVVEGQPEFQPVAEACLVAGGAIPGIPQIAKLDACQVGKIQA
mgnify:CR=1 FL=1